MQKKKRQKQNSLLVVLVFLFNLVTQATAPMIAYATTTEDTPVDPPIEETNDSNDSDSEEVEEKLDEEIPELLTIAEARKQEVDEVSVTGIVTAKLNQAIYIQDESAAIAIKQTDLEVDLGDEIIITGKLETEDNLLFLDEVILEERLDNAALPEPKDLTSSTFGDHLAELVRVNEVIITSATESEFGTDYTAIDSEDTEFSIRDEQNDLGLDIEEVYSSITGILTTDNDEHILIPRDAEDIVVQQTSEETETSTETETSIEEEPVLNKSESQALAEDPIDVLQDEVGSFDLSLMHMNDTHARVETYPKLITAIKEFRSEHENSLLFHAGDVFSGTLYFNEFQGQADLALMNLMGIDAMVFGNHEFDLGDSDQGHQALANFVKGANFPLLGTNIDFSGDSNLGPLETNASAVEGAESGAIYDSIVLDVDEERIGVFGLTTEDTEFIASPMSVKFQDYVETATEAVQKLENEDINKIIAVTHLGYNSNPKVGNDLLLAEKVEGIDVIVGGHSHTEVTPPTLVNEDTENPTVIVQAGQYADNLGTLNVTFDKDGKVTEHSGELLQINDSKEQNGYDPDPDALKVLEKYKEKVDEINNEETGAVATKDLLNPRQNDQGEGESVRANETELGNLVTDAMLAKTKEQYPETVIAFQNGGGIRAPIDEGPITVGEVINVLPFGNDPVVVSLTGQEIKGILEISVGAEVREDGGLSENGGFLHVSGMKFYYDSQKASGDRVMAMYIDQGGRLTEIDLAEVYLVATNAFTAKGGDGLTPFAEAYADGRVDDTGTIDWEQLRDYMIEEQYLDGVVDPVIEGRIVDLLGQDLVDYQMNQLRNRIEELEEAIRQLEAKNGNLTDEITALRELLAELRAALEGSTEDLAALEERIAELEARIAELEKEQDPSETEDPEEIENGENGENSGGSGDTGASGGSENGGSSEENTDPEEKPVGVLPQTGMNVILPLASGATLLLAGLGAETYRRKRK
ncbi:2',3'-cyclic-nucleotide 2'-phosphodiesterase/5'-or 3'-nucleotidase, 5'-nucleotidase family [Atopostipes suicloacalis DSM 15692]|uniref:2',3'-cyclic-nucleotide 2'-phosphodiesterase/5'-or 3'-nucleotidase, 5'-nucleotidase family n=1 Tax=Atopostipes suicloacalis DSM 15692 TaxID=1121025 RepID=A0A1M4Z4M9_9LACT|nr:5'-nucleotidase C-terminal domain-containing protein [Atopostipes suicloacalis]SHF12682.1 2',3'-cyclic-nucleotide 2'-phosphodiesterase/5'-or 3'-nucleotidase, 5'-nucleotidase family [Atopostipes suicloacalis DSM 15692]